MNKIINYLFEDIRFPQVFNYLAILTAFFFIASTLFDFSVTFTILAYNRDFFLTHEANDLLISSVQQGHAIWQNYAILINLVVILLYLTSYFLYRLKPFRLSTLIFSLISGLMILLGIEHIKGGNSWFFS